MNATVLRRQSLDVDMTDILVGDQIQFALDGFGDFTATAHLVTDDKVLFIFDEIVDFCPMNKPESNGCGFATSDLKKWMDATLLETFPDWLRDRIVDLTLPSYGQIFGHGGYFGNYIEPDTDEQLELMKDVKNRIAVYEDELKWYWLKNAFKKSVSRVFVVVYRLGIAMYENFATSGGVRPAFTLVRENSRDCVSRDGKEKFMNVTVLRRQSLDVDMTDILVGDQIQFALDGFGDFTATAHLVTDDKVLFIFDEIVDFCPMYIYKPKSKVGGFATSDLKKWMDATLLETFPDWLRDRIVDLTLPSYGQIYGHGKDFENYIEPDTDEPLELMKDVRNRIGVYKDKLQMYWLKNAFKKSVFSRSFVGAGTRGYENYDKAESPWGVRPAFTLVRENSKGRVSRDDKENEVDE